MPPPSYEPPKGNGGSCSQPSCGKPINPGTGNMWHTETDFSGAGADRFSIVRTYNSDPLSWDASVSRSFGVRWTFSYGAVLKAEPAFTPNAAVGVCWQRQDTGQIFCENSAPANTGIPAAVSISRSDGKKMLFSHSGNLWLPDSDINDRLSATYTADNSAVTGWTYVSANGDVNESYDASGLLISKTLRNGMAQRFTYSSGTSNDTNVARNPSSSPVCSHVQPAPTLLPGRLLCVTDNWGRQLNFEYDLNGRISKIIDSIGQITSYAYDGPSGGCNGTSTNWACHAGNLTSVTYPDGKIRTYWYNESAQINGGSACANVINVGNGFGHLTNALTGIVDENAARYLSWTYDCAGKATSSSVGPGTEKVTLSYSNPDANGVSTTTVTHYVNDPNTPATVRHYQYKSVLNVLKNIGIDGPCVECGSIQSRTYDANGNLASSTDFNGNVTTYTYDLTRNLETSRTEASGTAQARTITTSWHSTYRLPLKVAEPEKLTTYTYDASGNLLTRTERATTDANGSSGFAATVTGTPRTWTYTYNSVGQVLTADGPRTDVVDKTTYVYNAANGNLNTITDAVGNVTQLNAYTLNGQVGHIVAPNGVTYDLTYSPRGWLTQRVMSDGAVTEITSYAYDGVGQLTKVTLPDSSTLTYTYDNAHRLTDITNNLGDTIHYTLDNMGNRTSEQAKDINGNLARQISRSFDALNRLQQITGGAQ